MPEGVGVCDLHPALTAPPSAHPFSPEDRKQMSEDRRLLSSVVCRLSSGGGVAQLGEHLLCKQGVGGSNPLASTTRRTDDGRQRTEGCRASGSLGRDGAKKLVTGDGGRGDLSSVLRRLSSGCLTL